jgi:putative membrane protein
MNRSYMAAVAVTLLSVAGPAAAQSASKAAAPRLDDAEIAHAAVTANAVDIDMAELAKAKSKTPAVVAFAEMMIRDHSGVNQQASELAAKLKVTPKVNAVSESLRSGESAAKAKLAKLTGSAYDRAYMDNEVAYHQAVIDAVDGVLVPQTSNAELKALLQAVRPALVAHLEHAKMVRTGLK